MSNKKHHEEKESDPEEINETKAEAVATPENAEQVSAEIDLLKRQIEVAEATASEYKDSWLRSQAEFQNYQKTPRAR